MDMMKLMNPKYWLLGLGVVNILFSFYNLVEASEVAKTALQDHYGTLSDRELQIATGYEEGWGIFGIPYGIFAIGSALMLDEQGVAKVALLSGLTLVITFPVLLFLSGTNEYYVPVLQFAPILVLLALMGYSGYLHMSRSE